MKPKKHTRKYRTCELRRLMKESGFSYAEAGRRMGISRQGVQLLCYHHGLSEAVRKRRNEIEKIRAMRALNLLEDCHYCKEKAAKTMGMGLYWFNELLKKTGMRSKKLSMDKFIPHGISASKREVEAIKNLKKEIEKDLDVPISILELLRALIDFGKEYKDLIIHTILQNRAKYLGYEQEGRGKY